jgi:hypothetical protein
MPFQRRGRTSDTSGGRRGPQNAQIAHQNTHHAGRALRTPLIWAQHAERGKSQVTRLPAFRAAFRARGFGRGVQLVMLCSLPLREPGMGWGRQNAPQSHLIAS